MLIGRSTNSSFPLLETGKKEKEVLSAHDLGAGEEKEVEREKGKKCNCSISPSSPSSSLRRKVAPLSPPFLSVSLLPPSISISAGKVYFSKAVLEETS